MTNKNQQATLENVNIALLAILHEEDLRFSDKMEMFAVDKPSDEYALRLLILLADYGGRPQTVTDDLLRTYGFPKYNNFSRSFRELDSRGLLSGDYPGEQQISDPFFAYWIKQNYAFGDALSTSKENKLLSKSKDKK